MHDVRRGARQAAYQVLVASSPERLAKDEGDLWDSGKVESDQSAQVIYAGKPLVSGADCHWKVRLWDADGIATPFSKPALWSMRPKQSQQPLDREAVSQIGAFECSSGAINRLYTDMAQKQRAAFLSALSGESSALLEEIADAGDHFRATLYHTDLAPLLIGASAEDSLLAGDPALPWIVFQFTGDKRFLDSHYPRMSRWVESRKAVMKGAFAPVGGKDGPDDESIADRAIDAAVFAHRVRILAAAARELGREDDACKHSVLFDEAKEEFNKAFATADGQIAAHSYSASAAALAFDLLAEEQRELAAQCLVEDIKTGDPPPCSSLLLMALSDTGNHALACKLAQNDQACAAGPWLFARLAGIEPEGPGFKRLRIRPEPGPGIGSVKASYRSIRGRIAVEWKTAADVFSLSLVVPPGSTATVSLPAGSPNQVTEGTQRASEAKGVKFLRAEPGHVVYEVAAGQYQFTVSP